MSGDQAAALQTLAKIDREMTAITESQAMLDLVCRRAAELTCAPKSVIIIEVSPGKMEMVASYGLLDPARASDEFARLWQAGAVHLDTGGTCEASGQAGTSAVELTMPEFGLRESICTHILVPLGVGEQMLGVIEVFDTAPHIWSVSEFQTLSLLADRAAIALNKARPFEAE